MTSTTVTFPSTHGLRVDFHSESTAAGNAASTATGMSASSRTLNNTGTSPSHGGFVPVTPPPSKGETAGPPRFLRQNAASLMADGSTFLTPAHAVAAAATLNRNLAAEKRQRPVPAPAPTGLQGSLRSDAGSESLDSVDGIAGALPLLPCAGQYVWELNKVRKLGRGAFGVAWLVEAVSELPQWFPDDVDVGPFENAGVVSRSPSGRHRPQLGLKEVHLGGASPDVRVAAMRELQLLE
eukprot:CAMPEP_0174831786 /NCGR_PEP_ID=MMETSP1114-20130205/3302_1 /TAXON_ID=312471 /ORGANISM="Neobodo designis, Strain CCAP 1951/1" /LENGTH=237 /DNA_ID=CAMNT_0016065629 /DNA_START=32 /DNA_END=742 /DNA_ORIENTATION=+